MKVCLSAYTEGKETTDGTTILGFPIGSKEYINKSLLKLVTKVKDITQALKTNLNSVQTVGQLFSNSILPKFYHTLCADVFTEGKNSNDIFNFTSKHTDKIKDIILNLAKRISATDIIPEYVIELISRPTSQNGIHILSPVKSAISASCAPLMRSIQMAKQGIPLQRSKIILPMSIQRIYMNWNKSKRPAFTTLKNIYHK